MRTMSSSRMRLVLIVGLCVLWEILPRAHVISPLFIPALSSTLQVGMSDWSIYLSALWVTLRELFFALALSCGGGVICGLTLGSLPALRRSVIPIFSSIYAVPIVVLYPLMVVWFGIGWQSKVLLGAFYGFFPTVLATASGLASVSKDLLLTADSMGASRAQKALYVVLPATVPVVLAGVRLGTSLSVVGVVVGEMLTATGGIGFLISNFRSLLDTPRVFFSILLVVGLALLFDLAIGELERRTSSWRSGSSGRSNGASVNASSSITVT